MEYGANLDQTNSKGRKPIHNANDLESLELLLEHGAAINAKDGNGKYYLSTYYEELFLACVKFKRE